MRIVQLEAPTAGTDEDHLTRTVQPCSALGQLPEVTVESGSFLAPELHQRMLEADVLVLNQVVEPDLLPLIESRREAGRLTVYELHDQVLAPQPYTGAAALARNPLARSLSCQLGARAHALQLGSAALERAFAHLQPAARRVVFPTQLPEIPPLRVRPASDRLWLGWCGSLANLEDLKWVMPAVRAALGRHPQLGFSLCAPEAILGAIVPLFSGIPRARVRHNPGREKDAFLKGLDLGLCPLLPSDFNRCRTDSRVLELAARGIPALASDVGPYRATITSGETGFLFRGLEELGAQLDRLVEDAGLRARIGRAAHQGIAQGRAERDHAPGRLLQYRRWQAIAQTEARIGRPRGSEAGRPASGYLRHEDSATERALRAGLALSGAGRNAEALEAFAEAAARTPQFYLPPLYTGTLEPDFRRALAALETARALAPGSANVALQRGLRLEAAGRIDEAVRAYRQCRTIAPTLGAPDVQLGALCERQGDLGGAARHYENAYAGNRYFTPAVVRLAHRALAEHNPGRATRLLESALTHDPKMWRFHFLLGRAFCDVGRWQAAHHHLESALGEADEPAPVLALLARTQIALGDVTAAQATVSELRRLGTSGPTI